MLTTLKDAVESGHECGLLSKAPHAGRPDKVKYLCGCGCFAWDFCFHDVRGIPAISGDFICDGCYTSLERNLVDIDGNGKPNTIADFKSRYIVLHQ